MTQSNEHSQFGWVPEYRCSQGVDEIAVRNRQSLIDALDCLLEGDWGAFWALFDPEVTFHEASCLPYGGEYRGLEATKRAFAEVCATYSAVSSRMHDVLTAGDLCMLYQTSTNRVASNGNTWSFPVAELFRFRDGKVVEWRALYFDAQMAAKAIADA
jgi:ketosteroid isomerase-like protein